MEETRLRTLASKRPRPPSQAGLSGDAVNQEKRDKFDEIAGHGSHLDDQQLAETLARPDVKFGPRSETRRDYAMRA
jgi:hypothetical protein